MVAKGPVVGGFVVEAVEALGGGFGFAVEGGEEVVDCATGHGWLVCGDLASK